MTFNPKFDSKCLCILTDEAFEGFSYPQRNPDTIVEKFTVPKMYYLKKLYTIF